MRRVVKMLRSSGIMPAVFINTICLSLTITTITNLTMQKTCSPAMQPSINDFICNDTQLVGEATSLTVTKSTLGSIAGGLSATLFGSWRDSTGLNKPLLYIGQSAQLLVCLSYAIAAWNWSSTCLIPAAAEAVVGGLFGFSVFQLGVECVIAESSKPEERSSRLQTLHLCVHIAFLVTAPIKGYILTYLGYGNYFLVVAALHILVICIVRNNVRDGRREVVKKERMSLVNKMKAVFQPRPNRVVIWTMLACKPLIHTFFIAERNVSLYYLQQAFKFTVKEESMYGTYCLLLSTLGLIGIPILLRKLKWSDFTRGVVCSSLAAVSSIFTAFASTKTELYLIAVPGVAKFSLFSAPQAILNRCIRNDELGLFTGISSTLGIFFPFLINYLYSYVFAATSKSMPGAIFLISAAGSIMITVMFGISSYMYTPAGGEEIRKRGKEKFLQNSNEKEPNGKKTD